MEPDKKEEREERHIMSTEYYHKNGEKSMGILAHALRVWPNIISSLNESDVYILSVKWFSTDNCPEIHVCNIPQLKAWALPRVVHPRLEEHGDIYPWKVVYTVDGIDVFALMTEEERAEYYP
jgi:hypothetical protein